MQRILLKAKNKKQKHNYNIENDDFVDDELSEIDLQKKILNNRYIFLCYISKGTFSESWMVYDTSTFSFRNAKIYHSPENFDEFYNEKKIINIINTKENNNLLYFFDFIEEEKQKIIVSELLGVSILDIINDINENRLDLYEINIKFMFRQILNGLRELHSYNVIHCDIKPDNILTSVMPFYMENIIKQINELGLQNVYNEFVKQLTPPDFDDFNKSKKKNTKKKIKTKTCSAVRDYIFKKIIVDCDDKTSYDYNTVVSNSYTIKIIDFTNSENSSEIMYEENYDQSYRSVEIILNQYNNIKSDIWAVGCIFYELVTGQVLFDVINYKNKVIKNSDHLYRIFKIINDDSQSFVIQNSEFNTLYFTPDSKLKFKHKCIDTDDEMICDLRTMVTENARTEVEKNEFCGFLKLFFIHRHNMRPDCYTLLNQSYLT